MAKRKIVFLDFDGVLNTRQWKLVNNKLIGFFFYEKDMKVNNSKAIALLNRLCLDENLSIVVCSSWRKQNHIYPVETTLKNSGLNSNIEILGLTPIMNNKAEEILAWLEENGYNLDDKFIILEDNPNMGILNEKLILCDSEKGFSELEFNKALELLNTKQKKL